MDGRIPRMRIGAGGGLEIIDPSPDDLSLLQTVDPDFTIRTAPLPAAGPAAAAIPKFVRANQTGTGLSAGQLATATEETLWRHHAAAMTRFRAGLDRSAGADDRSVAPQDVSLLALKATLARRQLANCRLCARKCGADRRSGPAGTCGLGPDAGVAETYVHIAEEAPINPSRVISLAGCGLRCRYCQQGHNLTPDARHRRLDAAIWHGFDRHNARSLSFAGGNPDENLPAVLDFLAAAPPQWTATDRALPVVWNTHAYVTGETLALLDGVVDVYLPDLKYGTDRCGRRWSGVTGYPIVAIRAITEMVRQAPTIVRLLVLPGHVDCCHLPALERLAALPDSSRLLLSVRDQYAPDWRIRDRDGDMTRRPNEGEVNRLRTVAVMYGLKMI